MDVKNIQRKTTMYRLKKWKVKQSAKRTINLFTDN